MVASCMFYGALPPGNPADENRIGNFSFTWGQVCVYFLIISVQEVSLFQLKILIISVQEVSLFQLKKDV